MQLLRRDSSIEITEATVTTAAGNRSSGKEVMQQQLQLERAFVTKSSLIAAAFFGQRKWFWSLRFKIGANSVFALNDTQCSIAAIEGESLCISCTATCTNAVVRNNGPCSAAPDLSRCGVQGKESDTHLGKVYRSIRVCILGRQAKMQGIVSKGIAPLVHMPETWSKSLENLPRCQQKACTTNTNHKLNRKVHTPSNRQKSSSVHPTPNRV